MAGQMDCGFEEILPECNIPADLMVIILLNLPVKSLLRFKAVSKPWCCFISSPRFVNLHLRRQSVAANNNLLLSSDERNFGLLTNIHEKINTCVDTDVLILENPPIFQLFPVRASGQIRHYVIDACYGLVVVCSFMPPPHDGLILWNPATRKCGRIQLPDGDFNHSYCTLGLYYVEATSDFKIVGWADTVTRSRRPSLFVYTLSSDSWNKWDWNCDDADKSPVTFGPSTLVGGCMHWLSRTCSSKNVITAFDITAGAMSFFGVPDDTIRMGFTLAIGDCLSLVISRRFAYMESGFEVWIMEEYGVEESWVKRFTLREPGLGNIPITCWNEVEMVYSNHSEGSDILTFCDLFNSKKYFLEFKSFRVGFVFSYVESLVSLGTVVEEIAPSQLAEGRADLIGLCGELSI